MAILESGEHKMMFVFFEDVSERNNTLNEPSTNHETRNKILEEVSEL